MLIALSLQSCVTNNVSLFFILSTISITPLMSPCPTIYPVSGVIASTLPPVRYVTTGVPHAKDSRFVVGKLYSYVVFKNRSAALYRFDNS